MSFVRILFLVSQNYLAFVISYIFPMFCPCCLDVKKQIFQIKLHPPLFRYFSHGLLSDIWTCLLVGKAFHLNHLALILQL